MRLQNSGFLVPAGSFLIAVGMSFLGTGPVRPVLARQAAEVTACTGSATATSITVAAGSGIKKGVQGWNFAIIDQPITVVNSKKASISVGDMLEVDVSEVVATDTNNKKHPLGKITLQVAYLPIPVYENNNLPPPGSNVNAIPAQVTSDTIMTRLKVVVALALPTVTVRRVTGALQAQTTLTRQFITLICDGTELPATPRPETSLPVDNKGNGGPVKN